MVSIQDLPIITSSQFHQFPFILHGFGTKYFQERELNQFCQSYNLKPVFLKQQHSDCIHWLEKEPNCLLEGDALITSHPGLVLIIKTADCLPVLMLDPTKRIIAAAHCGWRGTSMRLLEKLVDFLVRQLNCYPENLHVVFGPTISAECYEVGEDVKEVFNRAGFSCKDALFKPNPDRPGYFFFDLRKANREQLFVSGIKAEKIEEIEICPHCHQHFLSRRRDGTGCGRLLNFICLL